MSRRELPAAAAWGRTRDDDDDGTPTAQHGAGLTRGMLLMLAHVELAATPSEPLEAF